MIPPPPRRPLPPPPPRRREAAPAVPEQPSEAGLPGGDGRATAMCDRTGGGAAMSPRDPCAHCGVRTATRPRRLCGPCYADRRVRRQYAPAGPRGRRGFDAYGRRPLPPAPTSAPPGSPAKVLVLAERARRRQQLFHPDDAGLGVGMSLTMSFAFA